MPNPSRSGRNAEKKMLRSESFHERVPVRPAQLRRPKTNPDLFSGRKLKEEVTVAPPRPTKLLVNVTLQGSLGAVHVIMSLESTVEELIAVALRLYKKEARMPLLQIEDPSRFDLHYSSFSLENREVLCDFKVEGLSKVSGSCYCSCKDILADQIVKTINVEPSLSEIELIEKCFGPQRHGHVFGYGGGIKIKNVKESESAQVKELKEKLHEKDEEILNLRQTVGSILDRLSKIEKERKQSSSMDPSQSNDEPNKDDA